MQSVKIVLLCIASAVVYGVLHDQVTARVCVEYFTIGHPPVFNTDSPTLLALGWGVIATWWVGLPLGVLLASASRLGSWPKYDAAWLVRPIGVLLVIMGCASFTAGIYGYFAANADEARIFEGILSRIPESKHSAFIADLRAHQTAYGCGFLGGIVLCGWVLSRRWRMAESVNGLGRPIGTKLALDELRLFDPSLQLHYASVFMSAIVAGLFWNMSSDINIVFVHLVAPALFALLVAFLFQVFAWEKQLLILLMVLTVAEIFRVIAYCAMGDGWRYISSDGETQQVLMVSFLFQCAVAWVIWLVARFLIRWNWFRPKHR